MFSGSCFRCHLHQNTPLYNYFTHPHSRTYIRVEKNSRGKPREKRTMHAFTEWFAVSNDKRTEYGLVISSINKHYKNTDRGHFRQNSFSAPTGWRRIMGIISGKYFYIHILINFINGGI